ncbi:unnamed protein product, partial [Mesorhabditis spiculigera]
MCASRDHSLLKAFRLDMADRYHYTNGGGTITVDGVDDHSEFAETVRALDLLGFPVTQQAEIFRILASILLLGNITFEGDDIASIPSSHNRQLTQLCDELFLVNPQELTRWLTQREIRAINEAVIKPLTKEEAIRGRDALSKMLYSSLFNWIVMKINASLANKSKTSKRQKEKFVGVLDIYGFETFDVNSFEQFCINYANEKLQQQFNQHVFKLEQEEYEREDLSWVRIDFYDNQPCIELIEGRPGLIDYLDEQCKIVKGSDLGWLEQMTNCTQLKKREHLQMPKIRAPAFTVRHFAADVCYQVTGFMEKNKDSVGTQILEVIAATKNPFVREVVGQCIEETIGTQARGKVGVAKRTVANQFRESLRELMTVLQATRPHYVRCIKPNDEKERFYFEPQRAMQQLRACGVLETVRISAAGYPSRWVYGDFVKRYRVLYPSGAALTKHCEGFRQFAKHICERVLEEDKFALGLTKIFFRTGQVALLERVRHETLGRSATLIQTCWRGFVARRNYAKMRSALHTIQASLRAFLAFRRLHYLQMQRAATLIQTAWRKHAAESKYTKLRTAVLGLQSCYRANRARLEYQKMRYEKSAITIQRYFRGYMVRRERVKYIRKVIKAQCYVRRWLAKRRLREARIEARSVGHLQKLNKGLENKIIELQIKLDAANATQSKISVLEEEKRVLERRLKEEHAAVETGAAEQSRALREEMALLGADISALNSERPGLLKARDRMLELEMEVDRLQVELEVRDGQRTEAEGRCQIAESKLEVAISQYEQAATSYQEQISEAKSRAEAASKELDQMTVKLREETLRKEGAEKDLEAMREQLLANASLLANGAMSSKEVEPTDDKSAATSLAGGDLALVMRQQAMIRQLRTRCDALQRDKERLRSVVHSEILLEELENRPSIRAGENLKLQELEAMNGKLRAEIDQLVAAKFPNDIKAKDMIERLFEEADRLRQENCDYRALLANNAKSSPRPDSGHWSAGHSETGSEYESQRYDTDYELNVDRQLRSCKRQIELLERARLDQDMENQRLQRILDNDMQSQYSGSSADAMRGQMGDIVAQNLELTEKYHRQADELSEVKAQLRGYAVDCDTGSETEVVRVEAVSGRQQSDVHSARLQVFNVPEFSKILISDLKPRVARHLTPCFPAYLLLTAFRYHDERQDETGLTPLFSAVHLVLKDTIAHSQDLDVLALWLVNSWRLVHLLHQYGEVENVEWQAGNTPVQNSQRMKNIDLAPLRHQITSRADDCYRTLMKKVIEPQLTQKIVPGVLLHESPMWELLTGKTSSARHAEALNDLLDFLTVIHGRLVAYGADGILLEQIFKRFAEWACSIALNHLMFRKDLCRTERAIQIKHNVQQLQEWLLKHNLKVLEHTYEPLIQAAHLLQTRKVDSNIDTICGEMTSLLLPRQILAMLEHYTPSDEDFEEGPVSTTFKEEVEKRLQERAQDQNKLIMSGTYLPPLDWTRPVPCDFKLETLSLPSPLRLQEVCRLV